MNKIKSPPLWLFNMVLVLIFMNLVLGTIHWVIKHEQPNYTYRPLVIAILFACIVLAKRRQALKHAGSSDKKSP